MRLIESSRPRRRGEHSAACTSLASADLISSRLTAFLWDGEGASEVREHLEAGTPATVGETARWMLSDALARPSIERFFRKWLKTDELATLPNDLPLDVALRSDMALEPGKLGAYVTLHGDSSLATLLTAPYTFVTGRLAAHYGMTDVTGDDWQKHEFETTERHGILDGAGVVTRFSSVNQLPWPAKMTFLLIDALLCRGAGEAPFSLSLKPNDQTPVRQQMVDATASAECQMRHFELNEPDFAFLKLDTLRRFMSDAPWGPFDTSGTFAPDLLAGAPSFRGLEGMLPMLADRGEVQRCFVRRWLAYAIAPDGSAPFGSNASDPIDGPEVERLTAAFREAGLDIRSLIVAVTETGRFATRRGAFHVVETRALVGSRFMRCRFRSSPRRRAPPLEA